MYTAENLRDELNFLTDTISTRIRTVAFGGLAFSWLSLAQKSDNVTSIVLSVEAAATTTFLLFFALVLDFLQYFLSFIHFRILRRRMDRQGSNAIEDSGLGGLHSARELMFWSKILFAGTGILYMVWHLASPVIAKLWVPAA